MVFVIDFGNENVKSVKFPTKIIKKMEVSGGKVIYGPQHVGLVSLRDISVHMGARSVLSWAIFWGLQWNAKEAMKIEDVDDLIDEYLAIELDKGERSGALADGVMKALLGGYGIDADKLKEEEEAAKNPMAEDGKEEGETEAPN